MLQPPPVDAFGLELEAEKEQAEKRHRKREKHMKREKPTGSHTGTQLGASSRTLDAVRMVAARATSGSHRVN